MKNITDLLKLVTQKDKSISTTFRKSTELSRVDLRFLDIVLGKPENEKQKLGLFISANTRTSVFRKQKSRLSEKLIRKILESKPDQLVKGTYDKVHYSCLRNLPVANLLYLNYARNAANELLERNIKRANRYHFTEIVISSARLLRYHSALSGDKNKFDHYDTLLSKNLIIQNKEIEAEQCSQQLILDLHHSTTTDESRRNKFRKLYHRVRSIALSHPTRTNMLNYLRLGIRYREFTQQHHLVLQICLKAEEYFQRNPHLIQKARLAEFALYKMGSCLQLRDYERGSESAFECEKLFSPGTDNWFIYLEHFFMLCMHTGNYERAREVLDQVVSHQRYRKIQRVRQEKWKIFEAYIHFILPKSTEYGRFNLFKFINEVPLHTSDKAGFNLAILIAQFISLINTEKYDLIIDIGDSLTIYCRRYIRQKERIRSYYFMKMLQVAIKYSFEPNKTEQVAQKFLERMMTPDTKINSVEELEVIPYDILWKIILQKLREADRIEG